jgi:phage gp37-like protein
MTIDREKLDRIQERTETGSDALRSLFARYRGRLDTANEKRRTAVFNARSEFQTMSLARLAQVSQAELIAGKVDVATLAAAFRDVKAADDLLAEHGRQSAAMRDSLALLRSLRSYAGREVTC